VAPGYEAMRDEWVANGPGNVQDAIAGLILGDTIDPAPWFAKWATVPRESFRLAFDCLMGRDDITGRVGEISCPAIVFHGDGDQAIPVAEGEALCSALSGCEGVVVVRGAAHAANLSHPDQVNPPLREFLQKHAG
jgi:pimeloyl-ACP methyl ester carboxylesterase